MAKIIGSALPNIPWQEPPANTRTPFWRYDANPIIGRDGNARSNSVLRRRYLRIRAKKRPRIILRDVSDKAFITALHNGR